MSTKKYLTKTGIIYRLHNSGATDKIVKILDNNGNSIPALVKNFKSSSSKKSSFIEVGNIVKLKLIDGYKILLVNDAKLISITPNWKIGYIETYFLEQICEIIDKISFENNSDVYIYKNLQNILASECKNVYLKISYLVLSILKNSGSLPELKFCIQTGKLLEENNIFLSNENIGFASSETYGSKVSSRVFKVINFGITNSLEKFLQINLLNHEKAFLYSIILNWFETFIDQKLKSRKIISSISEFSTNQIESVAY